MIPIYLLLVHHVYSFDRFPHPWPLWPSAPAGLWPTALATIHSSEPRPPPATWPSSSASTTPRQRSTHPSWRRWWFVSIASPRAKGCESASGQKGLIATEVFYYVREDITDSGSINHQGDQGKWQNHNIDYWMNLNDPTVNQLGHSVCQGDGDGLDPMIASLREDSCFTIGFQTSFLKHIGVAPHSIQANQQPQIVKNMNGIQVEWAIGAAIQHLGIYRNSNTYVSTPTKDKLEWSESETIVFALGVTFAVLSGLAVLAKVISSTDIASTIGNRLFLDKYATRGGRRRKAKNSDVKKGKYKRVNNTEEEDGVRLARGPVALKWKTSDEGTGFERGYKDEVV